MPDDDQPTILIVDDEETVAEAYALWLSDEYNVRVAHGGQEALEKMDEDVAVALLDRRMPRMTGDEVLEEIRDRGYECQVAMVTAVDPDFDIVEMDFDEYLAKPITREDIEQTVENLLLLTEYDEAVNEAFSLAKKQATLESRKNAAELEADDQYQQLRDRRETAQNAVDDTIEEMDAETIRTVIDDIEHAE